MREDMAQVIVERPRIKPFNSRKGRRQALDDLPTHEGLDPTVVSPAAKSTSSREVGPSPPPEPLKATAGHPCVIDRVLRISMSEIILHQPRS